MSMPGVECSRLVEGTYSTDLMDSGSDASAAISISMAAERFAQSERDTAAALLETKERLERELAGRETLGSGQV